PERYASVGSAAILLQVCFVYWFTAMLKSGPTWRDSTAIYYALSVEQFTTPLGKMLLHHRGLLRLLTFTTWRVWMLGPTVALGSYFSGPLRVLVILAFLGFHFSLGQCMELGLFPYISACAWLLFLPSWFWEKLAVLQAKYVKKRPAFQQP